MLPMSLVTGHFAYGEAAVVPDPLSGQPRFEIVHRQVYANNNDGIVSGANLWANYMGSLQRGWMGTRPVSEAIVKFRPITRQYDFDGFLFHPLDVLNRELSEMAARYRVGDGDGSALVSTAESCVQDSNQAMYAAITEAEKALRNNPYVVEWIRKNPDHPQLEDLRRLTTFGHVLGRFLTPFGVRQDWANTAKGLNGVQRTGGAFGTLVRSARSWRTMFPRRAYDHIVELLLNQGAKIWFIRTNQVGGENPTIWPLAPTTPFHGGDNKPLPKRMKV
jgi:predicted Abi (CAAX) family protease